MYNIGILKKGRQILMVTLIKFLVAILKVLVSFDKLGVLDEVISNLEALIAGDEEEEA